jgi:hypothetical protein
MANFVGSVHRLGRRLQDLAGYFDFSTDGGTERVTDFARCKRPVLLLYGFFATRRTFDVLEAAPPRRLLRVLAQPGRSPSGPNTLAHRRPRRLRGAG